MASQGFSYVIACPICSKNFSEEKPDDQSWTVDVLQHPTDGKVFYAKSDFLRSHVELTASLATDAIADLDTMFATE